MNIGKTPTDKNTKKSSSKSRKILFAVIFAVAAGVFIFSGIKLISIFSGYKKGSDTYQNIEGRSRKDTSDDPANPVKEIFFDVPALKKENPDTQGYLYGDDLFSYPVVQCDNNVYYLDHLFDGTPNSCGCLFIDCNIPDGLEAQNCIIYGHDMKDGSMFAKLHFYTSEDFYKSHKEMHVFTEDHHYVYKIFSAFTTALDGIVYNTYFSTDEDFINFLNLTAGACPYETDFGEMTADRKVITMSTCLGNDDDHRFVVLAIRDREIPMP